MRISDWSSDVCSPDLVEIDGLVQGQQPQRLQIVDAADRGDPLHQVPWPAAAPPIGRGRQGGEMPAGRMTGDEQPVGAAAQGPDMVVKTAERRAHLVDQGGQRPLPAERKAEGAEGGSTE